VRTVFRVGEAFLQRGSIGRICFLPIAERGDRLELLPGQHAAADGGEREENDEGILELGVHVAKTQNRWRGCYARVMNRPYRGGNSNSAFFLSFDKVR